MGQKPPGDGDEMGSMGDRGCAAAGAVSRNPRKGYIRKKPTRKALRMRIDGAREGKSLLSASLLEEARR